MYEVIKVVSIQLLIAPKKTDVSEVFTASITIEGVDVGSISEESANFYGTTLRTIPEGSHPQLG
jgi:hypothetical protein